MRQLRRTGCPSSRSSAWAATACAAQGAHLLRGRPRPGGGGPARGRLPPAPPAPACSATCSREVDRQPSGGGGAGRLRRFQPAPGARAAPARHSGRLLRLAAGMGLAARAGCATSGSRGPHARDLPVRGGALPRGRRAGDASWAIRWWTWCRRRPTGRVPARDTAWIPRGRCWPSCRAAGRKEIAHNLPAAGGRAAAHPRRAARRPVRAGGRSLHGRGAAARGSAAGSGARWSAARPTRCWGLHRGRGGLRDRHGGGGAPGAPMVVVYRLSALTYHLGRRFVNVPHFAMVNLIAGRRLVDRADPVGVHSGKRGLRSQDAAGGRRAAGGAPRGAGRGAPSTGRARRIDAGGWGSGGRVGRQPKKNLTGQRVPWECLTYFLRRRGF